MCWASARAEGLRAGDAVCTLEPAHARLESGQAMAQLVLAMKAR